MMCPEPSTQASCLIPPPNRLPIPAAIITLCERDVPRTSEMLIIHRSTLLYRLKKINALVNLNLDDPNQRVYLLLSLWVLDRGIPVPPEKDGDEKAQKPLLSVENYDMMYSD